VSEISVTYFAKNNFNSLAIGFMPVIIFLILYIFLIKKFSFKKAKNQ